jgi:dihydrofolate reductase
MGVMRKVILFNLMSLDGFFEGPDHNLDWHNVDEEFNEFAIEQLDATAGLMFGRRTYEMMASFWPSEEAIQTDPQVAGRMNSLQKFVFSKTLSQATWNNTQLVNGEASEAVARLRQQPGRDLFLFGSANLAATLTPLRLIDEYRVMINPMILGQGTALFQGSQGRVDLKLNQVRTFRNGNVLLYYQPAQVG